MAFTQIDSNTRTRTHTHKPGAFAHEHDGKNAQIYLLLSPPSGGERSSAEEYSAL